MLKNFLYKFNEGPLPSIDELEGNWNTGNCRRAIQYYLWNQKRLFLNLEQVLCPDAYYNVGTFVDIKGEQSLSKVLIDGDVIYAEKTHDKNGLKVNRGYDNFNTKDEYIISLHTAIFTNKKGKEIWHATSVEGKSCFWSLEKFLDYYRAVDVKRVLAYNKV